MFAPLSLWPSTCSTVYGPFILCYELWKIIYVKDAKELYYNDIFHNNM